MQHPEFDPLRPSTKREIVIDNFCGTDKLVIPKGTRIRVQTNRRALAGTLITVDAYVRGEAAYYGIELDPNDIEPR